MLVKDWVENGRNLYYLYKWKGALTEIAMNGNGSIVQLEFCCNDVFVEPGPASGRLFRVVIDLMPYPDFAAEPPPPRTSSPNVFSAS